MQKHTVTVRNNAIVITPVITASDRLQSAKRYYRHGHYAYAWQSLKDALKIKMGR